MMENQERDYNMIGESAESPIVIDDSDMEENEREILQDERSQQNEHFCPNLEEEIENDEEEIDFEGEHESEIYENTDSESEGEVENMDDTLDYTSPMTFEKYNHLCLYHRGYYPRRGTGTNRTNRDVTGMMIKIKTWSSGKDPSRYLNIIRDHADL
uniref:DDE_Tnp_1_7 domain-containing protein n=1 Tax=Strongyloides papillosus TaxID=174720 RepID=A0A0N5CCL0_STREA